MGVIGASDISRLLGKQICSPPRAPITHATPLLQRCESSIESRKMYGRIRFFSLLCYLLVNQDEYINKRRSKCNSCVELNLPGFHDLLTADWLRAPAVLQHANTSKHFIYNRHSLSSPSDPLPQRLGLSFWFWALYKILYILTCWISIAEKSNSSIMLAADWSYSEKE